MHGAPLHASLKGGTARWAGPMSVVFAGAVQSTWNLHRASPPVELRATRGFGEPAGGGSAPSRSAGSNPPTGCPASVVKKHCWVAGAPASILARSYAHTLAPTKVWASRYMLKVA